MKFIKASDEKLAKATAMLEELATAAVAGGDYTSTAMFKTMALNNPVERNLSRFVTIDNDMLSLKDQVRKLAALPDPILITGPSGTGKELIARALHHYRPADKSMP